MKRFIQLFVILSASTLTVNSAESRTWKNVSTLDTYHTTGIVYCYNHAVESDDQMDNYDPAYTNASASSKTPAGATYTLSNGTTVTKTGETLSTTSSDYNVIQVTNGTLNLADCTVTKEGDYSSSYSGDDTSFYGTNSAVYASGSSASINMTGGSITTNAKGANAIFATNGATITVSDITIDNSKSVSRGLHCTSGGIINASNVNITTRSETSSTVATDRGGGTITVKGGTITAKGSKSSVIYSTGTISVDGITGLSEKGPMATVEGGNTVIIENSQMTSNAEARGILLHQSNSGDAEGTQPVCTVSNSTLTTTNSNAPLCFATNVTGTLTLTDVTLNVASGMLMSVEYYKRGENSTGHLVLNTTQDSWTYTGNVDADNVNNVDVTIGDNVIWNGAVDTDNNAQSSTVTVENCATWNLTSDTYLSTLVNNGTINRNGYTLIYDSMSGNGTINETAGIKTISSDMTDSPAYNLNGLPANDTKNRIIIKDGKIILMK